MAQLTGLAKCISLSLLLMSTAYFFSRLANYSEMREFKERAAKSQSHDLIMRSKYENMELLHVVTIVHSLTCIIISGLISLTLQRESRIDRRQFFLMLGTTSTVTFLYFFSLLYVVFKSTQVPDQAPQMLIIFESVLDMIASLSNNTFSFIFALMMNFILLFGIFCLNVCSAYLADIAKRIEQRRTGGRNQNELELNNLSVR